MKKLLLSALILSLGVGSFAQDRSMRMPKGTEQKETRTIQRMAVGNEQVESMTFSQPTSISHAQVGNRHLGLEEYIPVITTYDLQSNGDISNRVVNFNDGSIAAVTIFSHEYNRTNSDRGTGYGYYGGGDFFSDWTEQPEERVEPFRAGWGTIAAWGANGEIMASHSSGIQVYTRENKGQGAWSAPKDLPVANDGRDMTWPRIATSGDNHEIIHMVAASQVQVSGEYENRVYYCRSTDGGENWTISYLPQLETEVQNSYFSADDYHIDAYGNTVAILVMNDPTTSLYMIKSEDNGLTWTKRVVWEHPYDGIDWNDEGSIFTDTLFGACNVSLALGYDGVAHVAMSTYEYIHSEVGDTYTCWYGRVVDGIAYWNDTQDGPITSEDGNPHHALRLWWPDEENPGYLTLDTPEYYKFCGLQPVTDENIGNWNNDALYQSNDYFYKVRRACSVQPAICVDPAGTIAVAYGAYDLDRSLQDGFMRRSVYASYYYFDEEEGEECWHIASDNLMEDFMHSQSEAFWITASPRAAARNQFVFTYHEDEKIGLYTNEQYAENQTSATDNALNVVRICSDYEGLNESINPINSISVYPNPAEANGMITLNVADNIDATISFYNITGQLVKTVNKNLTKGINGVQLEDLTSGVYFCTVSANGFNETIKLVVK